MKEYLTVSEFAEAVGKSKQAIYKALSTKLNNYSTKLNNQTVIHKDAISNVYGVHEAAQVEQPFNQVEQPESTKLTHTEAYIMRLEKDLEAAEEREHNQARLIEELTTSLQVMNRQNQSLLIENQNLKALMEPEAASTVCEETEAAEEPQKKSFWQRLFK